MKASQVVALPLAAAIVSLVAAPTLGQAAKRDDRNSTMSKKAAKQRAMHDVDVRAFLPDGSRMISGNEGGIAGAPLVSECFNSFLTMPVSGQFGWTTFTAAMNDPVIDTIAPLEGAKGVNLPDAATAANGTLNGIFSPDTGAQAPGQYTGSCKLSISATGGADYDVVFQAPSQGFLSNRLKFYYADFDGDLVDGDVLVLDDPDGAGPAPLAFQGTGFSYTPGTSYDIRIELDNTAGTQKYFINNTLIYTGTVFAGTSFEQGIVFSDSWQNPGELGKTDCVAFEPGLPNLCVGNVNGDGSVGVADLLAVISAWGPCAGCPADINGDNTVGVADLLSVIAHWGPCP